MRLAVIGSGAREHAIAWSLALHRAEDVFVLPGNGGTRNNVAIDPMDFPAIERFCRTQSIDLVIVGPEAPLAGGIVDALSRAGIRAFGPERSGARLESSKLFAKGFMRRNGVATAEHWSFEDGLDPDAVIENLGGRLVLKYDGLAGGKGVWVCSNIDEARAAVVELRQRHGPNASFLIERRLDGDELSVIGITDGKTIRLFPPSQDHKRLLDGDRGPNTGGMGAYCPVPQAGPKLLAAIDKSIVRPTLAGLQTEGIPYRGFLYFGVMVTDRGPKLLEYNVRLGDPEAQTILALVHTDLAELAFACLEGRLDRMQLAISPGAAANVVLASRGYPGSCPTGFEIKGLDRLDPDTLVFHGATRRQNGRLVTSGGRVLSIVGRGPDLDSALERAYAEAEKVSFEGMQLRTDIGRHEWKHASPESRS